MLEVVNCCDQDKTDGITGEFMQKMFSLVKAPYSPLIMPNYETVRDSQV